MNNNSNKSIAIIITLIIGVLIFITGFITKENDTAKLKYQIYLDGEKIGLINDTKELYAMINNEQASIKDTYEVDQVYPPKGFEIEKYISYDEETTNVSNIYNKIKDKKSFTIKGYTITVSSQPTKEKDGEVLFRINVLNKEIFEEAIHNVITSFVTAEEYNAYMNDTQIEIKDVGSLIENMYFDENINIKENYLNTDEKIYTNADDLTKYLMFGDDYKEKKYTVQKGDTIASVSENNQLSTKEFLLANPKFTSENNMLAIGETVNVALINPKLSLIYDMYIVEDNEVKYETEIKYDDSKEASYKSVQTKGQNGIQRVAKRTQIINGIENQGSVIDKNNTYMVRDAVNEVIVRGRKASYYEMGTYVDDGTSWAWPTNYPYTISSPYGWRGGEFHDGLDISGTGYGSPIYAISDGIVRQATYGGMVGGAAGLNVVIEHPNGYWSIYAHLSATYVHEGDHVSRKQKIAAMGHTGRATGTHLHLGVSMGQPYNGGKLISPLTLWR